MAKKFAWNDGRKVHSKSLKEHRLSVKALTAYGAPPNAPLAGPPLTNEQGYGMATATANRAYNPQIRTAQGIQASVEPYYQGYIADTKARQEDARKYAAQFLAPAQQAVTNATATAPGLDASSPQFAKEQEAAKGRGALAQLGASTLAANATATDAYFGGQANIAARDMPQARAWAAQQVAGLQSDRGQAITDEFGKLRTGEQNYALAAGALNLNTQQAAADVDLQRGIDPVTGQPLPADPVSVSDQKTQAELDYFNEHGYWPSTGAPKPKTKPGLTAAQKQAAKEREAKRVAGVREKSGKVISRVSDAISAWQLHAAKPVATGKTVKDKAGDDVPETRKATPNDVRLRMAADGYTPGEIHVALLRRVGKPLDKAAIDYLHAKGVRIPREWLKTAMDRGIDDGSLAGPPRPI